MAKKKEDKPIEYVWESAELNRLVNKFEETQKDLKKIIFSGKANDYHRLKLIALILAAEEMKKIHNKFFKNKITNEEYVEELITKLKEVLKED